MSPDPTILGGVDPELQERLASRRDVLRRAGGVVAVASVPVAVGLMARDAFGQAPLPTDVVDALNFALTLERLEAAYYREALKADGLIPDDARPIFETIGAHEDEHVSFLEDTLGDLTQDEPAFDFTAGNTYEPFADYDTFLLLAQAFEDTGQRAYRGAAPQLALEPEVLTQALTIHSVEARHAARVRLLRDERPWVRAEDPDAPEPIKVVYQGMGETTKYDVDVPAVSDVAPPQVTEAFDEPLPREKVLELVAPFVAG